MDRTHAESLLYQALETELGGKDVYATALDAAQNEDLREEWRQYREQTVSHHERLLRVFAALELDPDKESAGRKIIRHKAQGLVKAMTMAMEELSAAEAQLVAGECVVEAETKDHLNWSLLEHIVEEGPEDFAEALRDAVQDVVGEESEHLFHTQGWTRELWLEHLGFDAALPPPEEEKSVKTKIGAGRAELQRLDYT